MPKNKKTRKKQLNKYLVLTAASFQIGITIYLGSYIGKYFDLKYNLEKNWFTILFVLLALIISMYSLTQQLNKLNNE
jgi:membrane protein DedA with SNARE-associated domain